MLFGSDQATKFPNNLANAILPGGEICVMVCVITRHSAIGEG